MTQVNRQAPGALGTAGVRHGELRGAGLGFLVILVVMLPLAGIAIGLGLATRTGGVRQIDGWLLLETLGGFVACALGGFTSARIGGWPATRILAIAVFTLAFAEGVVVLATRAAPSMQWLALLVPVVGAVGVIVGGRIARSAPTETNTRMPWQFWIAPAAALVYALAMRLGADNGIVERSARVGVVLAELSLLTFVALRLRRALRAPREGERDTVDEIRRVARSIAGQSIAADIIATEFGLIHSAFTPRRAPAAPAGGFSHHRRVGYGAVATAFAAIVAIESIVVHLLLQRWSVVAAWVLTGLSLYSIVWLIGDYRAIARRWTTLTDTHVRIRLGLRWEVDVPLASIESTAAVRELDEPAPGDLRISPLRTVNVRIALTEPVLAIGMYGMKRKPSTIWLCLDDAAGFVAQVSARMHQQPTVDA